MKKLIIFDMDGVLFDSVTIAESAFLEDYPHLTRNHHKELLAGNIHEEIQKFKLNNTAVIRTQEEKESRKLAYSQQKLEVGMYEGMLELLKFLKQKGYILTINSSAMERNLLPLLEKADIRDMFDWVASAEVSRNKVEKFNMIEEKYQVKKKTRYLLPTHWAISEKLIVLKYRQLLFFGGLTTSHTLQGNYMKILKE